MQTGTETRVANSRFLMSLYHGQRTVQDTDDLSNDEIVDDLEWPLTVILTNGLFCRASS